MALTTFHNDEHGFINWRDSHLNGYIVSEDKPLVHRGRCRNMASFINVPSKMTTRTKYCFDTAVEMEEWARTQGRALRRNCRNCGS